MVEFLSVDSVQLSVLAGTIWSIAGNALLEKDGQREGGSNRHRDCPLVVNRKLGTCNEAFDIPQVPGVFVRRGPSLNSCKVACTIRCRRLSL